ncbi:MAG: EAL domain-containing protein [Cyanosarcina radialis HA8281-LM2]|jgi:diguanylate cyclase (GGDEF)-like protein|nr:EAL domain-containing protein [Cyanosarcina radialis HA8281-LM2]
MASEQKADILIVDDTPNNLRFLSTTLTEYGYKIRSVTDGSMALTVAQAALPDLILLDIKMPGLDGYEVCQRLKANEKTREIPVIFLSALDEVLDKVKAFTVGGVDYITKPFQLEEVLARIENHLSLQAAREEIRQLNSELEERVRQRTAQLEQEILERQQAQEELLYVALHDVLTGLPNRTWFMERLEQLLKQVKKKPGFKFAVLFLDCDRFRAVNDSLGHIVGDRLLISLARRLESRLRPGSTIARLGGDEFSILLEDIKSVNEATQVAENIHRELTSPFQLSEYEVFSNVSIGIVVSDDNYEQPEHLLRDADAAMYQAKAKGKSCYQVFDLAMYDRAVDSLQLETDLRRGLERDELIPYYQPIVSLRANQIVGFEALVRWNHPQQGLVPPGKFIPIAEETGSIVPIDLCVLRQACHQLRHWQDNGAVDRYVTISVNLSAKHFTSLKLLQQIDKILQSTGLSGRSLKLEITESNIMVNAEFASQIIEQLKSREIELIVDDFGTGYSSLSYLHRLPIDTLKIDRSFVSRMGKNGENTEILRTIISLARNLGMNAIAEGIETQEQLEQLKSLGCEFGQGFLFSRPVEAKEARKLLATGVRG